MEIQNAKISFYVNRESTKIEIHDADSNTAIVVVNLTPEELSACLSRQGYVSCKCITGNLDRVGKTHENKKFEFEITYSKSQQDLELACNEALFSLGMHEWVSDQYYKSQDSFFKKDGKEYARVIIRRWIPKQKPTTPV